MTYKDIQGWFDFEDVYSIVGFHGRFDCFSNMQALRYREEDAATSSLLQPTSEARRYPSIDQ